MIVCTVFVTRDDGSIGILNQLKDAMYMSPIVKRQAYLLRDRWRISTEPNAQVKVSFI